MDQLGGIAAFVIGIFLHYRWIDAMCKGCFVSVGKNTGHRKVVTREEQPYSFSIYMILNFITGTAAIVGGIATALS